MWLSVFGLDLFVVIAMMLFMESIGGKRPHRSRLLCPDCYLGARRMCAPGLLENAPRSKREAKDGSLQAAARPLAPACMPHHNESRRVFNHEELAKKAAAAAAAGTPIPTPTSAAGRESSQWLAWLSQAHQLPRVYHVYVFAFHAVSKCVRLFDKSCSKERDTSQEELLAALLKEHWFKFVVGRAVSME